VLAQHKSRTNIGVGLGIVLEIIGRILLNDSSSGSVMLGYMILVVGVAAFIWGCAQYAMAKGHSPWLGALGLLSIIGLIILVFLPDRHKQPSG
jgi:hypothetical protein